jgi:hypothetical protein
LRKAGVNHEYAEGWSVIHLEKVLVGHALTMQMVFRPPGHRTGNRRVGKEGWGVSVTTAWPVNMLQPATSEEILKQRQR